MANLKYNDNGIENKIKSNFSLAISYLHNANDLANKIVVYDDFPQMNKLNACLTDMAYTESDLKDLKTWLENSQSIIKRTYTEIDDYTALLPATKLTIRK